MITSALLALTATQIAVPILVVLLVVIVVFAFSVQERNMFFLAEGSESGAEAAAGASVTQWILPVVLLVLIIGIFILNYFRSKKNQQSMKDMVESLKVGDSVKTYSGIYGKIIEIVETTDGKVAVLETGSENNKGIFSIDINAIYGIDEKKPVVYDAEGNVIEEPAADEPKAEEAGEETKSEEVKEEVKEEKPKKRGKKAKKEKAEEVVENEVQTEATPEKEIPAEEVKPDESQELDVEKYVKAKRKSKKEN